MEIFKYMESSDYEQLVFCQDENSGLKAIIAIHDTTLGPALGGTRMWPYNSEEEAIDDALRLARGMTYKNAAAGLNLGGGKTVIIGDPEQDKNEEMFRALGRYVQSLNGRYITAVDVGTTVDDMDLINLETDYVAGVSPESGGSGNPATVTGYGVYKGMKAAAAEAFGNDSLAGKTVAVQGVGNVAYALCEYLYNEGAHLIVADINEKAIKQATDAFGAEAVEPDIIHSVDCDIYAPCALGGVLNDETIPQIKAKAIAGSANNQLKSSKHGDELYNLGIVYTPDYVINSGGVINVTDELHGYNQQRAMKKVDNIYDSLMKVFSISRREGISTSAAADHLAEQRIQSLRASRNQFLLNNHHVLNKG